MRRTSLRFIRVQSRPGRRSQGWLFGPGIRAMPVALGRAGIKADKREGDGGTPAGRFHPVRLWWRPTGCRGRGPCCRCGGSARDDAWCEDPDGPPL